MHIDINTFIQEGKSKIEQQLDLLIPEKEVPHGQLLHAARYSLLGGGKRLRPLLALAACESLNGSMDQVLIPACALEMVHTYSMIHDDLPCMDDDDFRRGKPSLHRAFPEAHAVLAGDFLLTRAFEVLAQAPGLSAEKKINLIKALAKGSGGEGMIAGQIMDIEAENRQIDLNTLQTLHRCKTGALIQVSIEMGAIVANAGEDDRNLLNAFAADIGLMFQIVDDILDVTASNKKHGKGVGSDLINGKATYVSLLGLEKSQTLVNEIFQDAISKLNRLSRQAPLLASLAELIARRNH